MRKTFILYFTILMFLISGCEHGMGKVSSNEVENTNPKENSGDQKNHSQANDVIKEDLVIDDDNIEYMINQSPDKEKTVYRTKDNKIILEYNSIRKVIYTDYPVVEEIDPYSVFSFDQYLVKWSANSKYLFINNCIYDVENDKQITLVDNVIFSWDGNRGVCLAEGRDYRITYDGAIFTEFFVGKKINVFESGDMREIAKANGDRYYVMYNFFNNFEIAENDMMINTAKLKYKVDELDQKIRDDMKGSYRKLIQENIEDELTHSYSKLSEKIIQLKEYDELKKSRNHSTNDSHIEFDKKIERIFELTSKENYYVGLNVRADYYLNDIEFEVIELYKDSGSTSKDHDSLSNVIDKNNEDAQGEAKLYNDLITKIRSLEEFSELKAKVEIYKKKAPVMFEGGIEELIKLASKTE